MSLPIKYKDGSEVIDGTNPVVILGPNGSGKTRLGVDLLRLNKAERIAALRVISLPENVPMQPLQSAIDNLTNYKRKLKKRPWDTSSEIANLFSKLIVEDSASAIDFRKYYKVKKEPDETVLMRLKRFWESLFPDRFINFNGYSPKVNNSCKGGKSVYPATTMSDGERVALYLAGRVLDATPGIIVIDEPEVHLHSRLAIQFWDGLEELRRDCRFVYITHDIPFARSRQTNDYIIVMPGQEPHLVNVGDGIPEKIVESILSAASFSIYASRIIFCEGTESSYDNKIFKSWFCDRKNAVIPVGSCKNVIKCTTTYNELSLVDGVTAIGIIDRDYWPDAYFDSMPNSIHVLPAHEIESLLCLRPIFEAVASHFGKNADEVEALYSDFYSEAKSRFSGPLILKQISERFRIRCSRQADRALGSLSVDGDEEAVRASHCAAAEPEKWDILPEEIYDEEYTRVKKALDSASDDFLKIFPGKVYFNMLVEKLGLTKKAYTEIISNALVNQEDEQLALLRGNLMTAFGGILPAT